MQPVPARQARHVGSVATALRRAIIFSTLVVNLQWNPALKLSPDEDELRLSLWSAHARPVASNLGHLRRTRCARNETPPECNPAGLGLMEFQMLAEKETGPISASC